MSDDELKNIDLEAILEKFAWENYDEAAIGDRRLRKLRKKHDKTNFIDIRIDWSKVNFENSQKDWANPDLNENINAGDASPKKIEGTTSLYNKNAHNRMLPDMGRPGVNVLFQTVFTNNSDRDQTYNLRTEKTTTSSCESVIESSFTKGFSMELTLKTPCEVFEANAGYSREFSLTKSKGETLEKSITWSVESSIVVAANKVAEAFLVVNEAKFNGNFEVTTYVWGDAGFSFHDMRKPDSPKIFYFKCGVYKIIKKFLTEERGKPGKAKVYPYVESVEATRRGADGDGKNNQQSAPNVHHIKITTKGKCDFQYGIKQAVLVNQIPLDEYETAA